VTFPYETSPARSETQPPHTRAQPDSRQTLDYI
jgi:hypothetical protein